jgi:hypothetical protein
MSSYRRLSSPRSPIEDNVVISCIHCGYMNDSRSALCVSCRCSLYMNIQYDDDDIRILSLYRYQQEQQSPIVVSIQPPQRTYIIIEDSDEEEDQEETFSESDDPNDSEYLPEEDEDNREQQAPAPKRIRVS